MGESEAARLVSRLVREFGERAFRFAFRLTGNIEDSRDLVAESYRRVLARWELYDPSQPLENWYFAILRHMYLDAAKRYERRWSVSLDSPAGSEEGQGQILADSLAGPEEGVLDSLAREESARAVREALEEIGAGPRAALLLCDVEGLSYAQIAEVLGWAPGTVRSRIFRARIALRKRLQTLEGAPA